MAACLGDGGRLVRRLLAPAATAVLAVLAPPLMAQDDSGPLRFLRPSVEAPAPEVQPAEPAAPVTQPAPPAEPVLPEPAAPAEPAPAEPAAPVAPGAETEPPAAAGSSGAVAAPSPEPVDEAPEAPAQAAEPPAEMTDDPSQPLRLAVIAGRDVTATMAAVEPMAENLGRLLDRPVEILPMSSYTAMIDAQILNRIDGGFYSGASFAMAEAQCRCLEPLAAPQAADGTAAYHAVIVARRASPIASAADLEGRIVAVGAPDSIGGRRMQLAGLLSEGIDPSRFGAVIEMESADAAVRLVAAGRADAAFAWSSLAGSMESGYSRGTLTDLVARGEIMMDQLSIIWRSPAIAHGPFAVRNSLPQADRSTIEAYLIGLEAAEPDAYDMLSPFYAGGFVAVEPADYGGLEALTTANVDALRLPKAPPAPAAPVEEEIPVPDEAAGQQ